VPAPKGKKSEARNVIESAAEVKARKAFFSTGERKKR
jgi:hypothetical protein